MRTLLVIQETGLRWSSQICSQRYKRRQPMFYVLVLVSSVMVGVSSFAPPSTMRPRVRNHSVSLSLFEAPLPRTSPVVVPTVIVSKSSTSSVISSPWWSSSSSMLLAESPPTPTNADVSRLQKAMATFYGKERDAAKAAPLLDDAIRAWEEGGYAPDERAALWRIRADCAMQLGDPETALESYSRALERLALPGAAEAADPSELPSATLGRARAGRAVYLHTNAVPKGTTENYATALRLLGSDSEEDGPEAKAGAARNPYAAWEWASMLRADGDYAEAYRVRTWAAESFDGIGDRPRAVLAGLDAAVDLACGVGSDKPSSKAAAVEALRAAVDRTTNPKVEGRDVPLLQRVIATEGQARVALAGLLWDDGQKAEAEAQLGEACLRMEQLDADDAANRLKQATVPRDARPRLGYSIDDVVGAGDVSCSRFRNVKFMTDTLHWPEGLQKKVLKLQALGKGE